MEDRNAYLLRLHEEAKVFAAKKRAEGWSAEQITEALNAMRREEEEREEKDS